MGPILASGLWRKAGWKRAFSRRMLALAAVLASVLTTGCSTLDFSYSIAPTALTLLADNYLDLDGEQETLLKERIVVVREWMRVNEAAGYARFLSEVRSRAAGKVALEDVRWLTEEGRRRWNPLGARLAVEMADLATRLTPENLAALRRKFARNNADYTRDTIDAPLERQREKRFERVKDNAERWYGSFDDAQLERFKALSDARTFNPRLFLQDRIRRQNLLLAILSGVVDKSIPRAEAEARLTVLMTQFDRGRSAEYQAAAATYLAQSQALTMEIANQATPAQRDTAQRRFKRWADDLTALANRKEP